MRHILFRGVALAALALLTACGTAPRMQDGIAVNDPFEGRNRRVHAFNKGLDARVIGPIANLARHQDRPGQVPGRVKPLDLVINLGSNLSLPGKTVNFLLQGDPVPAGRNVLRFAVNTTLGVLGMFDPAGRYMSLPESDTDFGETLARWGVGEGAYLELPVLGPSTTRDAAGKVVDLFIDPVYHVLEGRERALAFGFRVASKAGDRARFGDTVDSILRDSADSYAQTRLIYLMHRRHQTGETGAELDPYADQPARTDADAIDPYAP